MKGIYNPYKELQVIDSSHTTKTQKQVFKVGKMSREKPMYKL